MIKSISFSFLIIFLILIITGCSSSKSSPVIPENPQADINLPATELNTSESFRSILGAWTLSINHETLEAIVTPNRALDYHYNVKYLIPTPEVVINTIHPNYVIDADVTLTNPYTFPAYDVRLIIFTDEYGHFLDNADVWTGLYDIPAGQDINPFKAYAKDQPNRIFEGESQHTENLLVFNPPPGHPIQFAIDASYPGNCEEPYAFENFQQGALYPHVGENAIVTVDVLDWQNDVSEVYLQCPEITNEPETPFVYDSLNSWKLNLVNNTGAPVGEYICFLKAATASSGQLVLYKEITIHVIPFDAGYMWTKTWGGTSEDIGYSVALDTQGNLYVTGNFSNTVEFNPAGGGSQRSKGSRDIFLSKFDSSGNWLWTNTWGSTEEDLAYSVASDFIGNVYVTGTFEGTVEFNPEGGGVQTATGSDVYLSKFDSSGTWLWTKVWGGRGWCERSFSVSLDYAANAYVTGDFANLVDFNPDGGGTKMSNGGTDVFLSKFDTLGNWQWTKTWGGTYYDCNRSGSLDQMSNAYVVGDFARTVDFNPDGGGTHTSNGYRDAFVSKFNSFGTWQWSKTWGGTSEDYALSVSLDHIGNAYVSGNFKGTCEFNPDGGYSQSSNGESDAYLSKLDSFGKWQWTKTWGGPDTDSGQSVSMDQAGNAYVVGLFSETCNFNPDGGGAQSSNGWFDIFLSKFDSSGNWMWAITWGGAVTDRGYSVCLDTAGDAYVTGYFRETVDFKPDGGDLQSSNGSSDVFLWNSKY